MENQNEKNISQTPDKFLNEQPNHFVPNNVSSPYQSIVFQTPDQSFRIQDPSNNSIIPANDSISVLQDSSSSIIQQSPLAGPATMQVYQSPIAPVATTPQLFQSPQMTTTLDNQSYYIIKVPDLPQIQPTAVFVQNSQNQYELHQLPLASQVGYNPLNLLNQAYFQNGVITLPQFQPIVLQVPTVDLLQNKLDLSSVLTQPTASATSSVSSTIDLTAENVPEGEPSNLTDDTKAKTTYRQAKLKKFAYLKDEQPGQSIVSIKEFPLYKNP